MKYFLHDASRLMVSTIGLICNAADNCRKKIKKNISSCFKCAGFVSRDEFEIFSNIVKNIKARLDELDKKSDK